MDRLGAIPPRLNNLTGGNAVLMSDVDVVIEDVEVVVVLAVAMAAALQASAVSAATSPLRHHIQISHRK